MKSLSFVPAGFLGSPCSGGSFLELVYLVGVVEVMIRSMKKRHNQ
jgi:hypothetical protein